MQRRKSTIELAHTWAAGERHRRFDVRDLGEPPVCDCHPTKQPKCPTFAKKRPRKRPSLSPELEQQAVSMRLHIRRLRRYSGTRPATFCTRSPTWKNKRHSYRRE